MDCSVETRPYKLVFITYRRCLLETTDLNKVENYKTKSRVGNYKTKLKDKQYSGIPKERISDVKTIVLSQMPLAPCVI